MTAYRANRIKEAVDLWVEARIICVDLGRENEVADCDINIGVALGDLGQSQQAIEHFERARAIYLNLGFKKEVADCDKNIGAQLNSLRHLTQAMEHHERARALYLIGLGSRTRRWSISIEPGQCITISNWNGI